jgi:hypothetical protein
MLPLECHYVAEIRYQEHVQAARLPLRDGARSAAWLPRLAFGRRALVALRRGWLKLAGRPIQLPAAGDPLL